MPDTRRQRCPNAFPVPRVHAAWLRGLFFGVCACFVAVLGTAELELPAPSQPVEATLTGPTLRADSGDATCTSRVELRAPGQWLRARSQTDVGPALRRRFAATGYGLLGFAGGTVVAERPDWRPASSARFARHWPRSDCSEPAPAARA